MDECPFCGNIFDADVHQVASLGAGYVVECPYCAARGPEKRVGVGAVDGWRKSYVGKAHQTRVTYSLVYNYLVDKLSTFLPGLLPTHFININDKIIILYIPYLNLDIKLFSDGTWEPEFNARRSTGNEKIPPIQNDGGGKDVGRIS